MVVNIIPNSTHRELSKPDEIEETERTERTIEIGESSRTISSFRRHSLHNQVLETSLRSLGDDHTEPAFRRTTISCLDDLDMYFHSSERSVLTPLPDQSSSRKRITTRRANDIYLRERRMSVTMAGAFRLSMNNSDLLDIVESSHLQDDDEESVQDTKKGVSFGDVEIREYGIIPGDNPGGINGVPLTMEWDSFSCITIKLTRYEDIREQYRREDAELVIPAYHRAQLLVGLGFSREDVRTASKKAAVARKQRCYTLAKLRHHQMHERMERAKRTALNLFTLGYTSHAKRSYLKKHCPEYYQ